MITSPSGPRIALLLTASEGRSGVPHVSAVMNDVITRLRERGARVALIVPGNEPLDIAHVRPSHDLYVVSEKTPLILSLAGALTVAGANVVNTARGCNLARDKIAATAVLAGAAVPVPPSWATGRSAWLGSLLAEGPLRLEPAQGTGISAVLRLTSPDSLPGSELTTDAQGLPRAVFAQREVPSEGRDVKVFVVGEDMWAITRAFPARTLEEKLGMPVLLRPDMREAVRACGRALGLELYSVDLIDAEGRFFVVEVDAFPRYEAAPAAPSALADYLWRRAVGANGGSQP